MNFTATLIKLLNKFPKHLFFISKSSWKKIFFFLIYRFYSQNCITHLLSQDKSPIWSSSILEIWNGDTGSSTSVGCCGLATILRNFLKGKKNGFFFNTDWLENIFHFFKLNCIYIYIYIYIYICIWQII